MPSAPLYRRVLLKISGEALMGDRQYGIDPDTVDRIAKEVAQVIEAGAQVCLVVGGGNIFRGMAGAANGMERTTADYMGMLATVMNALALQSSCERQGLHTMVLSAIPMDTVCEPLDAVFAEQVAARFQLFVKPLQYAHAEFTFAFDGNHASVRQPPCGVGTKFDALFEVKQIVLELIGTIPISAGGDNRVQERAFARPGFAGDQDMLANTFAQLHRKRSVSPLTSD